MEQRELPSGWPALARLNFIFLVAAPAVYLELVNILMKENRGHGEPQRSLLYVFYAVALMSPLFSKFVKRSVGSAPSVPGSTSFGQYQVVVIIRNATIEVSYLLGLVWFYLSGQTTPLYVFYGIGIIWSAIYWPRKQEYFDFVQEAKAP